MKSRSAAIITTVLAFARWGVAAQPPRSPDTLPIQSASSQASASAAANLPLRLGIVMPSLNFGADRELAGMAEPTRNRLMTHLARPAFDIRPIAARDPAEIRLESLGTGVDYLISVGLVRRPGSHTDAPRSGGKAVVRASDTGAGVRPPETAGAVSPLVRVIAAEDVVALTYELAKGDGAVAYEGRFEAKAASDGEDVIAPLLERAAAEIIQIVLTGKMPAKSPPSQAASTLP
jgi:hypothetical protein